MLDLLKFSISAADKFTPQFGKLKSELGGVKGALAGVSDYARRTGRGMRNIGAGMSAGITAPLTLLGRESVRLYQTQVEAEGTVQQAILSTGGAAGRTLDELKALASGIQGLTTVGDEDLLRNVTAPLLTFTKIQGEVFDRAQESVVDMAALLKMDLKSASVLVGKALNDPVKGISALGRSGVQFTEDQKKVIKSLVETGDVAKAQTLILEELETQFKGQAAALAATPMGKWQQISNAIGDVKEELGGQIVPFLMPIMETVKEAVTWFAALSPEVKKNIVVFGGIAAVAGPVLAFFGAAVLGLTALTGAFATMSAVLLANPIGLAIAAVAAGAYLIYRNWESVSGWFQGLWERVRGVTSAAWQGIKSLLSQYTPDWLKTAWGNLGTWFATQWDAVRGSILIAWEGIKGLLSGAYSPQQLIHEAWEGIGGWFAELAPEVKAAFVTIWEAIKTEVSSWPGRMIQFGKDTVSGLISGLLSGEGKAVSAGRNLGRKVEGAARDALQTKSPSRVFMDIGRDVATGLGLGIAENADAALSEAQKLAEGVAATGEQALGFMGTVREGAKSIFRDVLTRSQSFSASLRSVLSGIGSRLIDTGISGLFDAVWPFASGGVIAGGRQMAFAGGGVVNGPTYFGMQGGTGLMGEAGPEGILPLARVGGKLGVRASGGGAGGPVNVQFTINAQGAQLGVARQIEDALRAFGPRMVSESVQAMYQSNREVPFR